MPIISIFLEGCKFTLPSTCSRTYEELLKWSTMDGSTIMLKKIRVTERNNAVITRLGRIDPCIAPFFTFVENVGIFYFSHNLFLEKF